MIDKVLFRMVVNLILTIDHSPQEPSGTLFSSEEKLESVMYSSIFIILIGNRI